MKNIHSLVPDVAFSGRSADIRRGIIIGVAFLTTVISPAVGSGRLPVSSPGVMAGLALAVVPVPSAPFVHFADFGAERVSPDTRHVADWIADSRDNAGADFFIVDKLDTRVYVFDAGARLRGSAPVLLGAAGGDDSAPGIGLRPIAEVRAHERTTPAGRFVAERGHNTLGEDVVWVDYDAAVSMHRVRATNPTERRLERLATPKVSDNRISYGCINVPKVFYETYIRPVFQTRRAVVYVLPEVKPVQQVFGSYDVAVAVARGLLSQR